MSSPPRYEIKTLNDFLKVPEDRMEACLAGFEITLAAARAIAPDRPFTFTWIDDGERSLDVVLPPEMEING